jgi:hypothetical protein
MAEKQIDGLGFDKLVFDALSGDGKKHGREVTMKLSRGSRELGISPEQILRAVNNIRQKGYPVISTTTRRSEEDGFRFPQNSIEYMDWRDALVDDLKSLIDTLKVCDAGAKAKFGVDLPIQQLMF